MSKKIGILGGTFDPPHKGHLIISKFSLKKLNLNHIIWAVTKKNPLKKKPMLPLDKRINLCKKIVGKLKKFKIKSYDNKIKSSETINLLKYLKKLDKNSEFYFLIGSDNLVNLHKWKNWRQLAYNCRIAVFPRRGYVAKSMVSKAIKSIDNRNLIFLRSKMVNISSSKIRENYLKYK
tara:strand:+ start:125 stop:655 length:531 start_codon:yes stop_codon:yes gene_type:complete